MPQVFSSLAKHPTHQKITLLALVAFTVLTGYVAIRSFAATTVAGLSATYYDNADLTGTSVARIDPNINFSYAAGASPASKISPTTWSARWTGTLTAPATGTFQFSTLSDDGARVWVGDQEVVNTWTNHSGSNDSGTISLTQGQQYAFKVEYYQNKGGSQLALSWMNPSGTTSIIPSSAFTTTSGTGATPSATPKPTTTPVPTPTPSAPPPTTTPSTTPVPSASPVTGSTSCPLPKYPTPSCTGVKAGTTFSKTVGDYTASTANEIIDGWHITGDIEVRATGVVIKNSQIDGKVANDGISGSSFSISDSTVGPASGCYKADATPSLYGHDFTATRVYLRNRSDGVNPTGSNVTVQDSFIQNCFLPASIVGGTDGFHSDGVQDLCFGACNNLKLVHNTIDARAYYNGQSMGNSALNLGSPPDGHQLSGVTLANNLFLGGGYSTDLTWDLGANWSITGNSWVSGSSAYAPISGEGTCGHQTWATDSSSGLANRIVNVDANYNVTSVVKTTGCVD